MRLHQPLPGAAKKLFDYAQDIPVIDTHEHVPRSETDYNGAEIRFGDLFTPYVSNDLNSAGMPFPEGAAPAFHCIEEDWDGFAPYWEQVKFGSYARPVRLALQKFYGADDLTRDNHRDLLARIREDNRPGLFKKVFRDACNIEKAVRCAGDLPDRDDPILVGNITCPSGMVYAKSMVEFMLREVGADGVRDVDELAEAGTRWMDLQVERGAIEFKARAVPVETPDRLRAQEALEVLLSDKPIPETVAFDLAAYIRESDVRKAAELGKPVAVHTGVWADFRMMDVKDVIGLVKRNPATRFDLYHLGIPDPRSMVQLVKNFPNAWMNLCWAHAVASDMVVNTLKEAIDMVPLNKVFAFGADYILFIEKVYGHLHMARENVALALGDRVDRNLMGLDEAKRALRAWFYDNPKQFYGI